MVDRLSEYQVCKLVKIYKQYECLWDVAHEDYKNREVRDNAYKEMLKKLNIPGMKLKHVPQKIKNLRTSYYTELRRIEASIKEGGKKYKPKVAWFPMADEMMKSVSRTLMNAESEPDAEFIFAETNTNVTQETSSTDKTVNKVRPRTKRKIPQTKHVDDEYDSYGKFIAFSLRSMPQEMSIIAKMEIQETIADIQLKALRCRKSVSIQVGSDDPIKDPLDHSGMNIKTENIKSEEEEEAY